MKLRRRDIAALPGFRDRLPALYRLAALDFDIAIIRIGGNKAIGMPDQNQIAITLQLVPGVGDDAALRRFHGGSFWNRYIYPVVAARFEALDDASPRGPAEFRVGRFGGHGGFFRLGGRGRGRIARRCLGFARHLGLRRFTLCRGGGWLPRGGSLG